MYFVISSSDVVTVAAGAAGHVTVSTLELTGASICLASGVPPSLPPQAAITAQKMMTRTARMVPIISRLRAPSLGLRGLRHRLVGRGGRRGLLARLRHLLPLLLGAVGAARVADLIDDDLVALR